VIRGGYNIGYDSFFNNIASNAASSAPNQNSITVNSTVSAANPRGLANFSRLVSDFGTDYDSALCRANID